VICEKAKLAVHEAASVLHSLILIFVNAVSHVEGGQAHTTDCCPCVTPGNVDGICIPILGAPALMHRIEQPPHGHDMVCCAVQLR
jgi:hypothetical protein